MDQTVRTASQLAVPMEYDAVQCSCSSQTNDRCVQCLERVAACTLLYFSKNSSTSSSSVIDLSSRGTPASDVESHRQPVTAVTTSLFACSSSSIVGKSMESLSNRWTENRSTSAPTPPPSDVDSGVMSPPSSTFSTDDSGESEDDDIPPVMKKSRLLELLTSDDTAPVNNWQSVLSSQFHPLDLSCHGNASKDQPTLPTTTTTIPATVTRHRAQQIVPQNSNPRTSVSHVQSEVVSTASKRKLVQHIAPNPNQVTIGRQQPHGPMTPCNPVGRGNVSESPVTPPGSAACVDVPVKSTVTPKTAVPPSSCFTLVETDSQIAQLATDFAVEGNGLCNVSTRQLTSLPIICTSVGGLLMPLSSTPATIIVVNCPPVSLPTNKTAATTTTPLKSNSGTGLASCAGGSSSSSSGSRLCPIAPAPPSMLSSNVSSLVCDPAAKEHGSVAVGARRLTSTHSDPQRKTFSCDEPGCGKTYFKNSHLKVHKRVHTGEKPFVCEYPECSKKFARSDELSRHRRTHTGEKRYTCTVCEQHFVRSDHLSKHLHRHVLCRTSSSSSAISQLQN